MFAKEKKRMMEQHMANLSSSAPPGIMELFKETAEHYKATGRRLRDSTVARSQSRTGRLTDAERQRIITEIEVDQLLLKRDMERILGHSWMLPPSFRS